MALNLAIRRCFHMARNASVRNVLYFFGRMPRALFCCCGIYGTNSLRGFELFFQKDIEYLFLLLLWTTLISIIQQAIIFIIIIKIARIMELLFSAGSMTLCLPLKTDLWFSMNIMSNEHKVKLIKSCLR